MSLDPEGAPEGPFLDELNDVADDAKALSDCLAQINLRLPEGFPAQQIRVLCRALIKLCDGTAGVAVDTLDYTRKRIPIWRKDYLPPRSATPVATDQDAEPTPDRESHLDAMLKALFASVSTAISVYEQETGESIEQEVSPETPVTEEELSGAQSPDSPTLETITKQALETASDIRPLQKSAQDELEGELRDQISRRLNDLSTEATRAATETSQKRPMLSLLKKAGSGLRKAGRAVLDACKNAEQLGEPAAETWGRLHTASIKGILTSVKIMAQGIEATIDAVRAYRKSGFGKLHTPDDATRKEWEKEAAVQILMGQPIPEPRRPFLRDLTLSALDDELRDLLIERGADLSRIYDKPEGENFERKIELSDLAPLQNLTALQSLNLMRTHVSDLTPLQNLTALQSLDLMLTQVSDLTPLQNLNALQSLDLLSTQVRDLAPLQNLTALRSLDLMLTEVGDFTPLLGLTSLRSLSLAHTKFSDLVQLQNLTALQSLDLTYTKVSDLVPLQNLTALQSLDLRYTKVSDLAPLSGLTELQFLDLTSTQVSDLNPVEHVPELTLPDGTTRKGKRAP